MPGEVLKAWQQLQTPEERKNQWYAMSDVERKVVWAFAEKLDDPTAIQELWKLEWEEAERYYAQEENKTKEKMSHKEGKTLHSFLSLVDEYGQRHIYMMARRDKILGSGAFGSVKPSYMKHGECDLLDISGQDVILKKFEITEENGESIRESVDRERAALKKIGELENFIQRRLPGRKLDQDGNPIISKAYIIAKRHQGKELKKVLDEKADSLNDTQKWIAALKICQSVQAVHDQGIIHGDIKPENFLVKIDGNNVEISLIDFGLSTVLPAGTNEGEVATGGTQGYMAPEVLTDKPGSKAIDVFALGRMFKEDLKLPASIYQQMVSRLPAERASIDQIMSKLVEQIRQSHEAQPSPELADILSSYASSTVTATEPAQAKPILSEEEQLIQQCMNQLEEKYSEFIMDDVDTLARNLLHAKDLESIINQLKAVMTKATPTENIVELLKELLKIENMEKWEISGEAQKAASKQLDQVLDGVKRLRRSDILTLATIDKLLADSTAEFKAWLQAVDDANVIISLEGIVEKINEISKLPSNQEKVDNFFNYIKQLKENPEVDWIIDNVIQTLGIQMPEGPVIQPDTDVSLSSSPDTYAEGMKDFEELERELGINTTVEPVAMEEGPSTSDTVSEGMKDLEDLEKELGIKQERPAMAVEEAPSPPEIKTLPEDLTPEQQDALAFLHSLNEEGKYQESPSPGVEELDELFGELQQEKAAKKSEAEREAEVERQIAEMQQQQAAEERAKKIAERNAIIESPFIWEETKQALLAEAEPKALAILSTDMLEEDKQLIQAKLKDDPELNEILAQREYAFYQAQVEIMEQYLKHRDIEVKETQQAHTELKELALMVKRKKEVLQQELTDKQNQIKKNVEIIAEKKNQLGAGEKDATDDAILALDQLFDELKENQHEEAAIETAKQGKPHLPGAEEIIKGVNLRLAEQRQLAPKSSDPFNEIKKKMHELRNRIQAKEITLERDRGQLEDARHLILVHGVTETGTEAISLRKAGQELLKKQEQVLAQQAVRIKQLEEALALKKAIEEAKKPIVLAENPPIAALSTNTELSAGSDIAVSTGSELPAVLVTSKLNPLFQESKFMKAQERAAQLEKKAEMRLQGEREKALQQKQEKERVQEQQIVALYEADRAKLVLNDEDRDNLESLQAKVEGLGQDKVGLGMAHDPELDRLNFELVQARRERQENEAVLKQQFTRLNGLLNFDKDAFYKSYLDKKAHLSTSKKAIKEAKRIGRQIIGIDKDKQRLEQIGRIQRYFADLNNRTFSANDKDTLEAKTKMAIGFLRSMQKELGKHAKERSDFYFLLEDKIKELEVNLNGLQAAKEAGIDRASKYVRLYKNKDTLSEMKLQVLKKCEEYLRIAKNSPARSTPILSNLQDIARTIHNLMGEVQDYAQFGHGELQMLAKGLVAEIHASPEFKEMAEHYQQFVSKREDSSSLTVFVGSNAHVGAAKSPLKQSPEDAPKHVPSPSPKHRG